MSKIVVFSGSPRKNGFSEQLLNKVVQGARAAGGEVVSYDLNDKEVRGCQSCYYCRSHEGCAQKDALQPMYKDIREAVGIVATFPIYFGNINGQSKLWVDRLYPMMGSDFSPTCPGKKMVAIYSQGNADPDKFKPSIDANNGIFTMFGWDVIKTFLITNTSDPEMKLDDKTLSEAAEIGRALIG